MKKVLIIYDNWCPNCNRFMRFIKKTDTLQLIEFKELRANEITNEFKNLNMELAEQQMASYLNKWQYGYVSLYYIFKRTPLFWPLFPFFYFLKITSLGQFLYVQLALKRSIVPLHCGIEGCNLKE